MKRDSEWGRGESTKSGRKKKAGNSQKEPEAKQTKQGLQVTRNSNAGDSEVEMQAENMVWMQEEEDTGQEYHVQDAHRGSRRECHFVRAREIYLVGLGFEFM